MTTQATIRGDGGEITLYVMGLENARARHVDDVDWLLASLSIKAGIFSGRTDLGIRLSELSALSEKLETALRTLKGHLQFVTMEDNWTLHIAFETGGAAIVTGSVTPDTAFGNTLNYEFRSDPISLETFARDIELIGKTYRHTVSNAIEQLEAKRT